jgi:SHS2 domain-containing protein
MNSTPPWLEEIDHTADVGIVVHAQSLPELYARAAWGLFHTIADLSSVAARETVTVTVTGPDPAGLMVHWLSELNYRFQTRHTLFAAFCVSDVSDRRLTARVSGEPMDPAHHTIHTEIKAVTYHGIRIAHDGNAWSARIIFDV